MAAKVSKISVVFRELLEKESHMANRGIYEKKYLVSLIVATELAPRSPVAPLQRSNRLATHIERTLQAPS